MCIAQCPWQRAAVGGYEPPSYKRTGNLSLQPARGEICSHGDLLRLRTLGKAHQLLIPTLYLLLAHVHI